MAKIGLPKGSGKQLKVMEKSGNFEMDIEWQSCGSGFCPKSQDGYQNNNGFSRGTMSVIFSDLNFRLTMFVSMCGYMKGNNLN